MLTDHMEIPSLLAFRAKALRSFSATDRWLAAAFLTAAVLAGSASFFFGDGARAMFAAPPYQPSLPEPSYIARDIARVFAATPPLSAPAPSVATTARGNWIRIPALSLNLPLAAPATMGNEDILRSLQVGVVRYPNGVAPGDAGVVVISGHSTGEPWKGRYRFAFMQARKLQPGDPIHVDHNGHRYTYRVVGQRTVNPATTPFLASASDRSRLSLVSCWPLWTARERLIIDAELTGTASLTSA